MRALVDRHSKEPVLSGKTLVKKKNLEKRIWKRIGKRIWEKYSKSIWKSI
jgi:hypothetical protein